MNRRRPSSLRGAVALSILVSIVALQGRALTATPVQFPSDGPASARKTVVALYWHGQDSIASREFERGLLSELHGGAEAPEYFPEFLETDRFDEPRHAHVLRDYLREKYRYRSIDVVVAESEPVLRFLLESRDHLFPGVPIVYSSFVPPFLEAERRDANLTGVVWSGVCRETLEMVRRLRPGAKRAYVVIGMPDGRGSAYEAALRAELAPVEQDLPLTFLTDLTTDALVDAIGRVEADSVILYVRHSEEPPRRTLRPLDGLSLVVRAAHVPVFGVAAPYVGAGAVGGYIVELSAVGAQVGRLATRVSHGTRPSDIPTMSAALTPVFDWRQLQKWGVSERALPPGSVVRFRPLTLWQQYRARVFSATILAVALAALGTGLYFEHTRRARAEGAARHHMAAMTHMDRRAALGQLTASLTHELGQPLAAILRNAEAAKLLMAAGALDRERLEEILDDIRRSNHRAGELIRRMRSLLQRKELELLPVDLKLVVREVAGLVGPDAARRRVRIGLDLPEGPCLVSGDRVHLEQVVVNLALNAIDAVSDLPAARREVRVRVMRERGDVVLSVSDRGHGFAAVELERLFEPFFTTKPDGMGMGLSIARSIVVAHRGRIAAQNNPDVGATVAMTLPESI